jgi:hypothetical protein
MATDDDSKIPPQNNLSRRDVLKVAIAGAAAVGLSAADATLAQAQATPGADQPKNPYGGGPSTGLQFPPYYKPTPSVRSRMNYFPGSEPLGNAEAIIGLPFTPLSVAGVARRSMYREAVAASATNAAAANAAAQIWPLQTRLRRRRLPPMPLPPKLLRRTLLLPLPPPSKLPLPCL